MLSLTYTISFLVIVLAVLIVNSLYIDGCLQFAQLHLRCREDNPPPNARGRKHWYPLLRFVE